MDQSNSNTILLVVFLSFFGTIFSQNTCAGDWEPFKNEKCLKVFDSELQTYDEAESYCRQKYDANLVSIGLEDKQKFVENFLKTKGISNEVWIGLEYESDNNYVWSDGTVFHYSNWEQDSPRNDPSYCVQMDTDDNEFGKWVDVLCTKKNIVLCEKVQPWSLAQIQNELMNMKQNLIPLGFIYVQLPKEKLPSEIWPWMTWEDVSSEYESVFFRVAGRNSSSFGNVQEQASPRITYLESRLDSVDSFEKSLTINPDNKLTEYLIAATEPATPAWFRGFALRQSSDEVRPRNMAVQIWKRTQ